jgi:predicted ribosome quality control (RQC) complex YloA/Tae2 family protein
MREIATLEIAALVSELKRIEGFYIDSFYEIGKNEFRIRLSRGSEKLNMKCLLNHAFNITSYIEIVERPTNFAIAMRKRIESSVIEKVNQYNHDRIIELVIKSMGSLSHILFEMFGKGNLILTDSEMRITLAYMQRDFRERSIRSGKIYVPPSNAVVNLGNIGKADQLLEGIVKGADAKASIMVFLSKNANVGSIYLEDMLIRLGVGPKTKFEELDKETLNKIMGSVKKLGNSVTSPKPVAYMEGDLVLDYAITEIQKYGKLFMQNYDDVQSMLDDVYYREASKVLVKENKQIKELEASMEKQRATISDLQIEIEHNRNAGTKIFERLNEINQFIEFIKAKKRITTEELQTAFPDIKVGELDLKDKTAVIEV